MAAVLDQPSFEAAAANPIYRRRLYAHRFGIALSVLAMAIGLGALGWILWTLLV